jgi:hypothetical protein
VQPLSGNISRLMDFYTEIDIKTICGRLDLVEEFTNQERMLIQVKDILPLLDLDKLLFQTQLVQVPKKPGTKSSQMLLKNIVKIPSIYLVLIQTD